jgi:hypothetical protein
LETGSRRRIPNKRQPSDIETQVQQFLKRQVMLGPELGESIVRLEQLASRILETSFDAAVTEVPESANAQSSDDLLRDLAAHISAGMTGVEGDLVRKSLQESFYQIVGTAPELGRAKLAERLVSFLRRRGTAGLVQSFLSLHVFNIVWFQTSDGFRADSSTPDSFLDKMRDVGRTCHRIVNSVWRKQHISGPVDLVGARVIVQRLQERLTGSSSSAA